MQTYLEIGNGSTREDAEEDFYKRVVARFGINASRIKIIDNTYDPRQGRCYTRYKIKEDTYRTPESRFEIKPHQLRILRALHTIINDESITTNNLETRLIQESGLVIGKKELRRKQKGRPSTFLKTAIYYAYRRKTGKSYRKIGQIMGTKKKNVSEGIYRISELLKQYELQYGLTQTTSA